MPAGGPVSFILKRQVSAPKQTRPTPGWKGKGKQNKSRVQHSKKTSGREIHDDMSKRIAPPVISQALPDFYKSEFEKKKEDFFFNFADKGTFYCVASILLCRAP